MNYADTLVRIERPTGSSLSAYDIPLSFFGLDSFQVTASSLDKDLADALKGKNKTEQAKVIGEALGKKALKKKISTVVFDRGGYIYTGRVEALANGAREAGLKF